MHFTEMHTICFLGHLLKRSLGDCTDGRKLSERKQFVRV